MGLSCSLADPSMYILQATWNDSSEGYHMNPLQFLRCSRAAWFTMPIAGLAIAWLAIAPTAARAESSTLADHSDCADVNQSGDVNSSDLIYLVNFVFKGGAAPDCPGLGAVEAVEASLRGATDGYVNAAGQPLLGGLVDQIVADLNTGAVSDAAMTLKQLGDSAIALYEVEILQEFEAAEVIRSSAILMPGLVTPTVTVSPDLMLVWFQTFRECIREFLACVEPGGVTTECVRAMADCIQAWLGTTETIDSFHVTLAGANYSICLVGSYGSDNRSWCATRMAWEFAAQLLN